MCCTFSAGRPTPPPGAAKARHSQPKRELPAKADGEDSTQLPTRFNAPAASRFRRTAPSPRCSNGRERPARLDSVPSPQLCCEGASVGADASNSHVATRSELPQPSLFFRRNAFRNPSQLVRHSERQLAAALNRPSVGRHSVPVPRPSPPVLFRSPRRLTRCHRRFAVLPASLGPFRFGLKRRDASLAESVQERPQNGLHPRSNGDRARFALVLILVRPRTSSQTGPLVLISPTRIDRISPGPGTGQRLNSIIPQTCRETCGRMASTAASETGRTGSGSTAWVARRARPRTASSAADTDAGSISFSTAHRNASLMRPTLLLIVVRTCAAVDHGLPDLFQFQGSNVAGEARSEHSDERAQRVADARHLGSLPAIFHVIAFGVQKEAKHSSSTVSVAQSTDLRRVHSSRRTS